jgi:hypothetical protein
MRSDIHAPKNIRPEDYEFVALEQVRIESFGDCSIILMNREIIRKHMETTGGTYSSHQHGGNCSICGAWAIYTALFYHPDTNSYIRTGMQCADKMGWGIGDKFRRFKTACKEALANKAGKAKAATILDEEGLADLWPVYLREDSHDHDDRVIVNACNTVYDIIAKLVRYGSLSEAQMRFLHGLKKRLDEWPARKAERAAERASAADCPTGRMVIEGTIVKTDTHDNGFCERVVMTVKSDDGWLVWGTIPSSISYDTVRGQRVRFTATITPSDNDEKFGFFKRPTKAEILSDAQEFAMA